MSSRSLSDQPLFSRELQIAIVLLRLALAAGLLSAVADRFGLWGPPGKPLVAWGTFGAFLTYTATLNPWCPARLIPALGWLVTLAESVLGMALAVGFRLRLTAAAVAVLTTVFAFAMAVTAGVQAPLNYSVFAFAAGAWLLSSVSREADRPPSVTKSRNTHRKVQALR